MTCIIGLVEDGDIYMGSDTAAVCGWEVRTTTEPKVFTHQVYRLTGAALDNSYEKMLIGFTTSFRMGQLLQYKLLLSSHPDHMTDMAYLVSLFTEDVRTCLKTGGMAEIDKNVEKGGVFLIGYHNHLYVMESDYQILPVADHMDAIGNGREYALGAMLALKETMAPAARIDASLRIAERFCGAVRNPFTLHTMKGEDDR